jgi:hypothetical protein
MVREARRRRAPRNIGVALFRCERRANDEWKIAQKSKGGHKARRFAVCDPLDARAERGSAQALKVTSFSPSSPSSPFSPSSLS